MTNKTILPTTVLLCLLAFPAGNMLAQPSLTGESEYRYDDARQLWHNTDMAAGLSLDTTRNRGVAYFDLSHRSGDYHRVQEGSQSNQLQFFTERYQTIGKYLYGYGRFQFDMGRTKGRAWSDVQRTDHDNPFIVGSSLPGKYDNQSFDFTAALGTSNFGGWRFGAQLDYKVSDLSRLRDPRSRSQLLDYRLTPSVTYTIGANTFGVSGYYNRRKEKIPNINTVQDDPNLLYYQMSGLEAANGTTGGYKGFQREWVNHLFGASLAYGYSLNSKLSTLNVLTIGRGEEYMYEQYKREPGRCRTYNYGVSTQNRLQAGRLLHQIDLSANYRQGYADEYRQELQIDNDPNTGHTSYSYTTLITFKKRYQTDAFDLDLHYRLNMTDDERAINGYIGLQGHVATANDKHLLPTSQLKQSATNIKLEGGKSLLSGNRLWIDAAITRHISHKADLDLANPLTDYAQAVLVPDQAYLQANYWKGDLSVTYQFPLTIKGYRSQWFAKLYGSYLKTDNSLKSQSVGLSVGVYY